MSGKIWINTFSSLFTICNNFLRFYQSQKALGSLPMRYHCWVPFNFSVGCIHMEVHQRISFYVFFSSSRTSNNSIYQQQKIAFLSPFFSPSIFVFFFTFSLAISPRRTITTCWCWYEKSQRCSFFLNSKTFIFTCSHPRILICTSSNECCYSI